MMDARLAYHAGRSMALVAALTAAAWAQAPPAEPTASIPDLIAELAVANDLDEVDRLYAQGKKIDRKHTTLHRAYMKRTLLLGWPSRAYHGATLLTGLVEDDGIAWSILTYHHAKRGKMLWAFTSGLRAIRYLSDDPAVQNNTGMLIAWYESQSPRPRLAPKTVSEIAAGKAKWETYEAYLTAYQIGTDAFTKHQETSVALQKDVDEKNAEYKKLRKNLDDLDAAYRRDAGRIASYKRDISRMRSTIRRYRDSGNGNTKWRDRNRNRSEARRLEDSIDDKEAAIRGLEKKNSRRKSDAADLKKKIIQANADANTRKQALRVHQLTPPELPWKTPRVDGKATVDREEQHQAHARRATTQPATSQPWTPPSMDTKLKLARMFISNNRRFKAEALLHEIITVSPDSPEAAAARKLIEKHRLKMPGKTEVPKP